MHARGPVFGGPAVTVPGLIQALYQGVQVGERGVDPPVLPRMQLAVRPGLGVFWEQREELPGLHCGGAAAQQRVDRLPESQLCKQKQLLTGIGDLSRSASMCVSLLLSYAFEAVHLRLVSAQDYLHNYTCRQEYWTLLKRASMEKN